jgi:glycosyltransferase involved in cell wall biosynthesis
MGEAARLSMGPSRTMQTTKLSSIKYVTFAVAMNNREVFESNFLASPCLQGDHGHQILVQEGFSSAAKAYNDAIRKSVNDLIIFCHQDILLPENWLVELERTLDYLEIADPHWGVLGAYGKSQDGLGWGHVYSSGREVIGEALKQPVSIQTLDEIVLILRKSSGLRFDDDLPHFHFYGTDICLRAAAMGMKSYAISAFCVHNTHQPLVLPREFYECCKHIKKVWKAYLPIQTTCVRITRFNSLIYKRRLLETYLRYIRRKEFGGTRVRDSLRLLEELQTPIEKPYA